MKSWSLFRNRPLRWRKLPPKLRSAARSACPVLSGAARALSPPSSASISAKCASVSVGGGARLNAAILCRTSIASCSRPRPSRNLGLSWNVKTT
jgi:hypothetical protein